LDAVEIRQVGGQSVDVIARQVEVNQRREYVDAVARKRQQLITGQLQRHQLTNTSTPPPSIYLQSISQAGTQIIVETLKVAHTRLPRVGFRS